MGWPSNGAECVLRGLACRKDAWCVEPQQEFQRCCRLWGGAKQGVTPHIVLLVPPLPGLQVAEVSVEKRMAQAGYLLGRKTSTLQLVHHQGQGPNSKATRAEWEIKAWLSARMLEFGGNLKKGGKTPAWHPRELSKRVRNRSLISQSTGNSEGSHLPCTECGELQVLNLGLWALLSSSTDRGEPRDHRWGGWREHNGFIQELPKLLLLPQ